MKKALGIVVLVVVVVGFRFMNRGDDSAAVLAETRVMLSELDTYVAHAKFLDNVVERAHLKAFSAAYSVGGRREPASYNEDIYRMDLIDYILASCQSDRSKADLRDELRELRATF